jgi:phosphohistidine phosphatase SixA
LDAFLKELVEFVVKNGIVEGLFVCGLLDKGVQLFTKYIDQTSDVQTASLVMSHLPYKYHTKEVKQWIERFSDSRLGSLLVVSH